jgi:protein SCO1/2
VAAAAIFLVLILVRMVTDATPPRSGGQPGGAPEPSATAAGSDSPAPSVDIGGYLEFFARPAPPLELTGPDGEPVSLADYEGLPVLVFFGYTHCPDVCPATIGAVGEAIDAYGAEARAIFVSVDPERDTVAWLDEFVKYMPSGFTAVTGSAAEVRTTADAWGVRYARVDTGDPNAYTMSHTADVFVVDGAGRYRAKLPFGSEPATIAAVLREVVATTVEPTPPASPTAAPNPSIAPSPTTAPISTPVVEDVVPEVVSSSVWAGGDSPVIVAVRDDRGRLADQASRVTAQVVATDGTTVGPVVEAVAVQPEGVPEVSFVATLDFPGVGSWGVMVEETDAAGDVHRGTATVTALDPGGSAALGERAPATRTSTAADYGGNLTWVTTDPLPDPRLSSTSTSDALAAERPFVLVVDSVAFKVTPACGRAVVMARRLLDRWGSVPFIHHEPYRYTVITTEPVLEGTLSDPRLTDVAEAWGVGAPPWGVGSMPWLFIVDDEGLVRAKYQGVMGTADVDVMLSLLASED